MYPDGWQFQLFRISGILLIWLLFSCVFALCIGSQCAMSVQCLHDSDTVLLRYVRAHDCTWNMDFFFVFLQRGAAKPCGIRHGKVKEMRSALVSAGRMRFAPSNLVSGSINRTRGHRDGACGRGRSPVSLKVSWFGESQWYANTDGTCTDRGLTNIRLRASAKATAYRRGWA